MKRTVPNLSTESSTEYAIIGVVLAGIVLIDSLFTVSHFLSGLAAVFVLLVGALAVVPGAWPTLYRNTGVGAGAWLLAAGVAGGGIALSYYVGEPQPFCDGVLPYRGCLTSFGWASVFFLASAVAVAIAVGHASRYRRLRNASVVPADTANDGLVAVEGRVVPASDSFVGPVSDQATVWYRSAVETPMPFNGYRETDRETVGNEFYVEDGSGRLLVLPDRLDDHDVTELARSHTEDDGEQRRREWSYRPDDVVTVVGYASDVSRAEYPEPVVVGLEEPVIVGRGQLSDLRSWAARRAVLGGAIALVVGSVSLAAMLLAA